MNFATRYMCYVVGEEPAIVKLWQPATVRRMKAFAIALHIPVTIWAVSSYAIASMIFELGMVTSALITLFWAGLIYLVERLILVAPKVWYVNFSRILIGVIIATLGSGMVDLVIFNKDITQQLLRDKRIDISAKYERLASSQKEILDKARIGWLDKQEEANCEANGKCGSGIPILGPRSRELSRQAEVFRQDYIDAQHKLEEIYKDKTQELANSLTSTFEEEGLLTRLKALHSYVSNNNAALIVWLLCFALILFFELMVVLTKLFFGETVDDQIEKLREDVIRHNAERLKDAETSPTANARKLLKNIYSNSVSSTV
ncbi:DUF4407 domain-containing protein [Nitrosospira briensis]|uniref:DUF4407 domain-containing protein n=1 Tax=Nitrosospira briensis TaxID=35799 RepID=UPI00046A9631|nr:DUF4407 domain-containing protein [Nitrosospira briensis]